MAWGEKLAQFWRRCAALMLLANQRCGSARETLPAASGVTRGVTVVVEAAQQCRRGQVP
jgi:hypothetical protein